MVWTTRPEVGHYGYLAGDGNKFPAFFYFDQHSLADVNASPAVGDYVRFGVERDCSNRLKAVRIRITKPSDQKRDENHFRIGTVTNVIPERRYGFVRMPESLAFKLPKSVVSKLPESLISRLPLNMALGAPTRLAFFHFDYFPSDTFVPGEGTVVDCQIAHRGHSRTYAYNIWRYPIDVDSSSPAWISDLTNLLSFNEENRITISRDFKNSVGCELSKHSKGHATRLLHAESRPKDACGEKPVHSTKPGRKPNTEPQGRPGTPALTKKLAGQSSISRSKNQPLDKGPFQYDRSASKLVFPNRKTLSVPMRFDQVLSALMVREPGGYSVRLSRLNYKSVAALFENGKLQEDKSAMSERERQEAMKAKRDSTEENATKIAQEFRRQFGRWLRENGVDDKVLIKCRKKDGQYSLGTGWNPKRMVINDSEVGLLPLMRGDLEQERGDFGEDDQSNLD